MVKVDRVISVSDLRRVLPKAVFQTRFSSEGGSFLSRGETVDFTLSEAVVTELCFSCQSFWGVYTTVCVSCYLLRWIKPTRYICCFRRSRLKML